uniref:Uncharacterized protein n=1 Tax=Clytia hemisphaerica TaxID=252671 RepID=A0A7M5XKD2_9CNID
MPSDLLQLTDSDYEPSELERTSGLTELPNSRLLKEEEMVVGKVCYALWDGNKKFYKVEILEIKKTKIKKRKALKEISSLSNIEKLNNAKKRREEKSHITSSISKQKYSTLQQYLMSTEQSTSSTVDYQGSPLSPGITLPSYQPNIHISTTQTLETLPSPTYQPQELNIEPPPTSQGFSYLEAVQNDNLELPQITDHCPNCIHHESSYRALSDKYNQLKADFDKQLATVKSRKINS